MAILTYTTDEKARISLPKDFANSTVLVEQVSDTELRIRKARVIAEDEFPFVEETIAPLSDRDRDVFLELLDNPPPPNDALRRLMSGPLEQGDKDEGNSLGLPVDKVGLLSWPDFFARVRGEQHPAGHRLMQERLRVLGEIRGMFAQKAHFREIDYTGRKKIAGLFKSANPNFLLFGSMQWVGLFKQAIKENNEEISRALDEIPLQGAISREQFDPFINRFLKAFKRAGMALASRLLAMKRPDTFVCVNNQNREGLFQAFGIRPSRDAQAYWNLIEKIRACTWWNAPPPAVGDERDVWEARTAFLDALFYTGAQLAGGSR